MYNDERYVDRQERGLKTSVSFNGRQYHRNHRAGSRTVLHLRLLIVMPT